MKEKLTKNEFIEWLQTTKEADSVQGVHYSHIRIEGGKIKGIRDSTQQPFMIDAEALYQAYKENDVINTSILKEYINNRAQAPAYAILIKMGALK